MKLKIFMIILRLLCNKQFRNNLLYVFEYAFNNHQEKRGAGAADVLIAINRDNFKRQVLKETKKGIHKIY